MKRITMADVAAEANVSKSTVSQYINKRFDYMGVETKRRIQEAIEKLGYQPNIIARSLKQKKTSTIGVIVANILHSFSTQVIRAIEDYCHDQDFHVIVCNADENPVKERNYIEMLRAKQVDGLIIFPTGENLDLYDQMVNENYPLVLMDRLINNLSAECILLDNEKASALAVSHFIKNGYRSIGIVTTSIERKLTPRVERINGYKKALNEHGIEVDERYIVSVDVPHMKEAVKKMLKGTDPPKALLAGNDLALMEILNLVKEENIQIPEELAVIGIDEVSFANVFNPPLSTVAQPAFPMGEKAASRLLELIGNPDLPPGNKVYRFEPKLHDRNSGSKKVDRKDVLNE